MNDLDDLPVDLSPGPSFLMPQDTHREQVAQRLTEKASQSVRKRKRESANASDGGPLRSLLSPSPKRGSTPALSPAVQRLVAQKLRMNSSKLGLSSALLPDQQLRQSYSTPSPLHRPATPGTVASATPVKTPSSLVRPSPSSKPTSGLVPTAPQPATPTAATPRQQKSLTDDLLNI